MVDESGLLLAITAENPRLTALGDPLDAGEQSLDVQACTVVATRSDAREIVNALETIVVFGSPVGPPGRSLDQETIGGRDWVLRSGQGEVAYLYVEFARDTVAVEVGRVVSAE